MIKTIAKITYSDAVVPEFDSSGRPDLLGWDDAMESHQPEEEVLAVFHDEDIAALCKPVIKGFFDDVNTLDLKEVYQSDDVELKFETREEKIKTTKWFWEEIVQDTSVFYDHSLGEKDADGKEYQWEDEAALHKQVPAMDDFLFCVKEEACFRVEDPRSNALNNLEQMYQLADKWYGENEYA